MVADDPTKPQASGVFSPSATLAQLLTKVEQVAATNTRVLVLGETGAGKGLLAQTIHTKSPRREQAFIPVNCGALPVGLVESELFGHEKGAFTGAVTRRIGFFEQAHSGTLFLDEIGDLPLEAQRVLLHVLEEDRLTRIGGKASMLPVKQPAAGQEERRPRAKDEDEQQRIVAALEKTNWVVSGNRGAACLLGMSVQTLRYRMRKYGIQRPKR